MQAFVHYFLHLGFPCFIAVVFFRKNWRKAYIIFVMTMLVDLDHLLADPIFQADRCSVGFHLFHSWYAMVLYVLLLFRNSTRVIGVGLLFHMFTDLVDCMFMFVRCASCYEGTSVYPILQWIDDALKAF